MTDFLHVKTDFFIDVNHFIVTERDSKVDGFRTIGHDENDFSNFGDKISGRKGIIFIIKVAPEFAGDTWDQPSLQIAIN